MNMESHAIGKTSRPVGDGAISSITETRGDKRPNERAVLKMTQTSTRRKAVAGANAVTCEAGFAPETMILTMTGDMPVDQINPGDRIITRRGVRKVKTVMRHTLPEGTKRIVISANSLGGKPQTETVVMAGQRILIRDERAQLLWGKDVAAPTAARLVDGEHIRTVSTGRQAMVSLFFGEPEIVYADGLELGSADKVTVSVDD